MSDAFNKKKPILRAYVQADRKARSRDIEIQHLEKQVLTDEEFEKANEFQAKAQAAGFRLIPEKKVRDNVKFVQIIQENWGFLQMHGYLKNEEIVFLMSLVPYVGFGSNAIVDDPKKKQPIGLNQSELATVLGTSRQKVSRVVINLVEKGLIAKAESGVEGNNAKSYVLFLNPHIMYAGDRNNIESALKIMFGKPMKMPIMKSLPLRFF